MTLWRLGARTGRRGCSAPTRTTAERSSVVPTRQTATHSRFAKARCRRVALAAKGGRGNRSNGERLSQAPRRSQACAAGLASPLPALRLGHGTRARCESTPARHAKSRSGHPPSVNTAAQQAELTRNALAKTELSRPGMAKPPPADRGSQFVESIKNRTARRTAETALSAVRSSVPTRSSVSVRSEHPPGCPTRSRSRRSCGRP